MPTGWVCAALVIGLIGLLATSGAALGATPAWTTYRHDAARSGMDPDSTTPVAPSAAWETPAAGQSGALDGAIYGQPLVYGSRVYVATENDTIYSLDAGTGAVVWSAHLATPESASDAPCGNISPTVGITGTPVIDPATNRIYAVAAVAGGGGAVTHELFAVDLGSGRVSSGFPISADPTNPPQTSPIDLLQRAALTLQGGRILVGYGGNSGDCGTYWGWLVSLPESGSGSALSYQADSGAGHHGGAIWGAGSGPAIDASGHVWVTTGNGNSGSTFDYSESVTELDANLNRVAYWAPRNWSSLDSADLDLGSSEPTLLPGNLILQTGKDNNAYLISQTNPGGISAPLYTLHFCPSESLGGSVFQPQSATAYVACVGGLRALSVNTGSSPSLAPKSGFSAPEDANGPPILAGGLVWVTSWSAGKLYGLDPATGAVRFQAAASMEHFATPSAGGGRLFLGAGNQVLAVTIAAAPTATTTTTTTTTTSSPTPSATRPLLSHLQIFSRRLRAQPKVTLNLALSLSEASLLRVTVSQLVGGHRRHHRCLATARTGASCQLALHRVQRSFHGRGGAQRLTLILRGFKPGNYLIALTATTGGKRSPTVTARLTVLPAGRG